VEIICGGHPEGFLVSLDPHINSQVKREQAPAPSASRQGRLPFGIPEEL